MDQNLLELYDDIILACGSGGSIAGLTIGNYLTGQKIKLVWANFYIFVCALLILLFII